MSNSASELTTYGRTRLARHVLGTAEINMALLIDRFGKEKLPEKDFTPKTRKAKSSIPDSK